MKKKFFEIKQRTWLHSSTATVLTATLLRFFIIINYNYSIRFFWYFYQGKMDINLIKKINVAIYILEYFT